VCPGKQYNLGQYQKVKGESEIGRYRWGECDRRLCGEINDRVAQDLKRSVTDVKNTIEERSAHETGIKDRPFLGPETRMPQDPGPFRRRQKNRGGADHPWQGDACRHIATAQAARAHGKAVLKRAL
jgi:hypothetical protein